MISCRSICLQLRDKHKVSRVVSKKCPAEVPGLEFLGLQAYVCYHHPSTFFTCLLTRVEKRNEGNGKEKGEKEYKVALCKQTAILLYGMPHNFLYYSTKPALVRDNVHIKIRLAIITRRKCEAFLEDKKRESWKHEKKMAVLCGKAFCGEAVEIVERTLYFVFRMTHAQALSVIRGVYGNYKI